MPIYTTWGKMTIGAKTFFAFVHISIDRSDIYPRPQISSPLVCAPGAGNALKAFLRDIGEGVHTSMVPALIGLNITKMITCVTVSLRIMVKQMRENCNRFAVLIYKPFHPKKHELKSNSELHNSEFFSTRSMESNGRRNCRRGTS